MIDLPEVDKVVVIDVNSVVHDTRVAEIGVDVVQIRRDGIGSTVYLHGVKHSTEVVCRPASTRGRHNEVVSGSDYAVVRPASLNLVVATCKNH